MSDKLKKYLNISMIAALYTVVSLLFAPFSYADIQVRLAETLIILVLFKKEAIYGLTLGCFLTNLIGIMLGYNIVGIIDLLFGTAATFLSSSLAYYFKNLVIFNIPLVSLLMPVIFNALIIGFELNLILFSKFHWINLLILSGHIFIGQFIACIILGIPLYKFLKSINLFQ